MHDKTFNKTLQKLSIIERNKYFEEEFTVNLSPIYLI